jgi:hypothetical protein
VEKNEPVKNKTGRKFNIKTQNMSTDNSSSSGGFEVRLDNTTEIFYQTQDNSFSGYTGSSGHHIVTNFSAVHTVDLAIFRVN